MRRATLSFIALTFASPQLAQSQASYSEVVPSTAVTKKGLFSVHQVGTKTLVELPNELLGKDILWTVERGQVGTAQPTGGGRLISAATTSSLMIRFERRDGRIFVRNMTPSLDRRSSSNETAPGQLPTSDQKVPGISRAVSEASLAPTMLALPIAAESPSGAIVLDFSGILTNNIPEFNLSLVVGASAIDPNRSYIDSVQVFPRNALFVYLTAVPISGGDSISATFKHSITLLPETPMKPRRSDPRVGHFTVGFEEYTDGATTGSKTTEFIRRYRLEKKDPKAAVSEPVKPIVYYVGRTVPEKWRPYVRQAIEDWQPAFEAAGFKKGIIAKDAPSPQEDPTWDSGDTRHSVVRWIANPIANAIGPNIADPRSGEILAAHVLIWEDVLQLAEAWYFTMCAGVDTRARFPFPDELTGQLIRYAVAHEVGHTLGLRHNHKASTAYSVAQLRDPAFTAKYGSTASIMAYGRMNYVAQPEDKVPAANLMPRIGPYDFHAIKLAMPSCPRAARQRS